ncbi:helix-turn-helix transcriptional regulator [Saccharopolyspora sp. 6V]|uniref:helix-turn-helix domain-containing protein n=1 Tax=Saccharopolyspora sp. 6V TaxID=2877239 RepID=UPI001CD49A81|nr:helix-turn-helix transcriptional regulator [Saccharopolyspora sp. 6V]MCA1195102.1 helix-turn-helix domain-containing protein [Saccharopolyspora sp. 6V]
MPRTLALRYAELHDRQRAARLSDHALAARMGVSPSTVSRVLSGRTAPGPAVIAGLIDVFGPRALADLVAVVDCDRSRPRHQAAA